MEGGTGAAGAAGAAGKTDQSGIPGSMESSGRDSP